MARSSSVALGHAGVGFLGGSFVGVDVFFEQDRQGPQPLDVSAVCLIRQTSSGPRGSKTYELTDKGLDEVRRWLREEDPERTVRNEAALRIFFLWLLEPKEAAEYLEREAEYQRSLLEEFEAIAAEEKLPGRGKQKAYRVALEGGLRATRARLDWARWAARQYRARKRSG